MRKGEPLGISNIVLLKILIISVCLGGVMGWSLSVTVFDVMWSLISGTITMAIFFILLLLCVKRGIKIPVFGL